METAKVDIQRLQLLNDRIAQCFDALNQVRLSVHGLQHTSGIGAQGIGAQGIGAQGFGAQGFGQAFGPQSFGPQGYGAPYGSPFAPQVNPYLNPYLQQSWANPYAGLSHSTPGSFGSQVPFGAMRETGAFSPLGLMSPQVSPVNPYAQQVSGIGGAQGIASNPFLGLSHTTHELDYYKPLWADPILAAKVAQTFPFIQLPVSPIGV